LPPDDFDLVVLGAGTGGYTAAIRASQLGLRTAIVEEAKLGGICLHLGCIPMKLLLQSSEMLSRLRDRGAEYGVVVDGVKADAEQIGTRRDAVIEQLHRGVQGLMRKNKIEVIIARGQIRDADTVVAGSRTLRASHLMLATGSHPKALPGLEFDGKLIINSDHATRAVGVPKSICIIGAGAVGVEFATYYHQMGTKVTLLEALDRVVPLEDEDVSRELLKAFQQAGIECRLGVKVEGAKPGRGGVAIRLADGEVFVDQLLVAVGRSANTEGYGLEKTGVELDGRGFVKVDEWSRTSVEGVHAIGDLIGGFLLAHAAAHEGIVAVEDMAGKRTIPMAQELVTRCTYSHPQIGSVGLSEAEAKARGLEVKVGRFPFVANARALIHGEPGGFAKMVADAKSGQVLGAHVIGVEATELVSEPALARLFQGDAWELGRNIHPHPTLTEVIGEAALAVDGVALNV
jgi:dihydrolipoamide dehydrogenase